MVDEQHKADAEKKKRKKKEQGEERECADA
jgi:hypothetical protein